MIIVSRAMDMYNYILGWNNYNKPLYPFSHNLFIFHIFTCDHFRFLSLGKRYIFMNTVYNIIILENIIN